MLFLLAENLTCPHKHLSVAPCTCCSPALFSNSILNFVSKSCLTYLKRWFHPVLRTVCQIHNLLSTHFCAAHLLHICLHRRHMLGTPPPANRPCFSTQVFLSDNTSAVDNSSLISPLLPFHPTLRGSQRYSSAAVLCGPFVVSSSCVQTCSQTPVQLLFC